MAMPLSTPWTIDELDRLPDDGNRYEVLDGELLVTPAPSDFHQDIVDRLSLRLWPFVIAHNLGRVQSPRAVIQVGDSQLEPDLMVRPWAPPRGWKHAPLPILVVEVLSKATRQRDLGPKRGFYVRNGIAEYWVVDRETRSVLQIKQDGESLISIGLEWQPPLTTATLVIDVAELFV
jgi:Uma2 family endonuclease